MILHVASLIRLRPSSHHNLSSLQLVVSQQPNVIHVRIFGCVVHVPIAPPQRSKMGLQRHLGIYIGFYSPFIIQYLDPQTGDVFMTCFSNCHFDETIFPSLRGGKSILEE